MSLLQLLHFIYDVRKWLFSRVHFPATTEAKAMDTSRCVGNNENGGPPAETPSADN